MNVILKLQLTITVAAIFFNAAVAKESSIRILPNSKSPVKAPIEFAHVMVPTEVVQDPSTKAPVKGTSVPMIEIDEAPIRTPIHAPIKPVAEIGRAHV